MPNTIKHCRKVIKERIRLPLGAIQVLSVESSSPNNLDIWFMSHPSYDREFGIVTRRTGRPLKGNEGRFVKTILGPNNRILHIFEAAHSNER